MSELAAALVQVQANLPKVHASRTADTGSYSYKYADLADVTAKILPVLTKHDLAFTARPTLDDGTFVLSYQLVHTSGETLDGRYPLPLNGSPQQQGSAITYARRYALCAVVGLVADDDDDAQAAEQASDPSESFHQAVRDALKGLDLSGDELAAGLSAWVRREVSKVDDLTDAEAQKIANKLKTGKSRVGFEQYAREQANPEPEAAPSEGFAHAVSEATVDEVKVNVADGLWDAKDVLDIEESGKQRTSLVEWLYGRLA